MSVLIMRILPDPILRRQARKVGKVPANMKKFTDDMIETMHAELGVGLAANQIGSLQKVAVIQLPDWEEALVLINPEIVKQEGEREVVEGCLSIPEQYADVTRPAEVEVRWLDRDGKEQQEAFDGLWATCVQHEIDHLDGKLFIDYLKPLKRQMITRKMVKLKRELARG